MARHPGAKHHGPCPTCGKHIFASRRDARAAARYLHPHDVLRAYQCGPWWHYVHNPDWLRHGAGNGPKDGPR